MKQKQVGNRTTITEKAPETGHECCGGRGHGKGEECGHGDGQGHGQGHGQRHEPGHECCRGRNRVQGRCRQRHSDG